MDSKKIFLLQYGAIFAVTLAFIIVSSILCNNTIGVLINIVAVLIMSGAILWGMGIPSKSKCGISVLTKLTIDLNNAQKKLEQLCSNPEADIATLIESEPLFQESILADAFQDYQAETDRLSRSGREFYFCDISDYINNELLEEAAYSSYNNLVGGMMTGLGILGTFIGLTLGLMDFRNNSANEMMESIGPLMDGIKVAFLTSIFGMVSSLVFNTFYHRQMSKAETALNAFLRTYYEAVPRTDHEGLTQLLQYQAQQTKSMEQFAEDISLALAKHIGEAFIPVLNQIDLSMKLQTEQLPQAVSEAIEQSVVPTLTGIEDTIGELANQMAETQNQNMGRIAQDFVAHIDEAMGSQMEHLGESIKTLCDWQESTSENMKNIADRICETGDKLSTINEDLQKSVDAFEGYMQQLEAAQASLTAHFDTILSNFQQLSECTDHQNEVMDKILDSEAQSLENIRHMSEATAEGIVNLKDTFRSQQEQVKAFYDDQRAAIQQMREQLSHHLSEQEKSLSDAIKQQTEMTSETLNKQLAELENDITAQRDTAIKAQESLNASLTAQEKALSDALKQQAEQITTALKEHKNQLVAEMQKIDALQKSLVVSMENATTSMERSATAMTTASNDLTANLDSAMERTYRQIDKQLAEVVRHLSGTISEIRNTTEKVPQIIQMSADQSQQQTNRYLQSVAEAQNKLSESVSALTKRIERTH